MKLSKRSQGPLHVVPVGEAARPAAEFFANNSICTVQSAAVLDEVPELVRGRSSPILIIVDAATINTSQYTSINGRLATEPTEAAIGFLHGFGSRELLENASRMLAPPPSECAGVAALVDSDLATYVPADAFLDLLATSTDLAELAANLNKPWQTLFLAGHSNGLEVRLPGGILVCRRNSVVSPVSGTTATYPCFLGADCQFTGTNHIVLAPEDFKANSIVALSCWGVLTSDHAFSPQAGVGYGLLQHSSVATLLTAVGPSILYPDDVLTLSYLVRLGLSFGRIANIANMARLSRGLPPSFVCFGDPQRSAERTIVDGYISESGSLVTTPRLDRPRMVVIPLSSTLVNSERPLLLDQTIGIQHPVVIGESLFCSLRESEVVIGSLRSGSMEVEAISMALSEISVDLPYFLRLAHALQHQPHVEPVLDVLRLRIRTIEAMGYGWRPRALQARTAILGSLIVETWETLLCNLKDLSDAIVNVFKSVTTRGSSSLLRLSNATSDLGEIARCEVKCPYCNAGVMDLRTTSEPAYRPRVLSLCDVCGPIAESPLGVPLVLNLFEGDATDADQTLAIKLENPWPFPVLCRIALIRQTFGPVFNAYSESAVRLVSGFERFTIQVPLSGQFDGRYAGWTYLNAIVVLGSTASFLRRLVHVRPSI